LSSRLQSIVDEASEVFGRPVAIDDHHMQLLVHTEHPPDELDEARLAAILKRPLVPALGEWIDAHGARTATGPFFVEANLELGLEARLCAPIRCHDRLLGFFWLTDRDRTLDSDDLDRVSAYAAEAGVDLYREMMLGGGGRGRERELLRSLLSSAEDVRREAAAELGESELFAADGAVVVVLAPLPSRSETSSQDAVRTAVGRVLARTRRQLPTRCALDLVTNDHGVLLIAPDAAGFANNAAAALVERLQPEIESAVAPHVSGWRQVIAVGGTAPTLACAVQSYEEAQRAARVAGSIDGFGDVVAWDDLGVYKVLSDLGWENLRQDSLPAGLRALLASPRLHLLVTTLEAFLDNGGDVQRTSAALYVHRTSLYHRLRRIEEIAGVDLGRGDDRLALHLGIKLVRLNGFESAATETDEIEAPNERGAGV
jgi:hypothetical protein